MAAQEDEAQEDDEEVDQDEEYDEEQTNIDEVRRTFTEGTENQQSPMMYPVYQQYAGPVPEQYNQGYGLFY